MPLKLNARRRYALERCDKFKWYPRAGWRFESAAVNALVRDFVSAQWVTEKVTDKGTRTLVLSDIGQKILGGGDDSEQGTVERPAVD